MERPRSSSPRPRRFETSNIDAPVRSALARPTGRHGARASSAVEFAIAFPTLLILLLFGTQLVIYLNAVRKVEQLASSMSEMISQASPPSGSTTATVSAADLHFAYDSGLVIFPYLMKDAVRQNVAWWQDIYIDYSSIKFTAIPGTNCNAQPDQSTCYTAKVVWTSSGTTGPYFRPCGTQQIPAANSLTPNNTTLPASIFGPNPIIVVDVRFTFRPTFATRLMSPITITRSNYVTPRYATLIDFNQTNNDGIAQECP